MAATRALLVPIAILLALSSSCRSVRTDGRTKPVDLPIEAILAFEDGEFEQVAAFAEVRSLASSGAVVVVWWEIFSAWVWVKALPVPAGKTLGETLLEAQAEIYPSEILRVVVLKQGQRFVFDGPVAMNSPGESQGNPLMEPGAIVFVEKPPRSKMLREGE